MSLPSQTARPIARRNYMYRRSRRRRNPRKTIAGLLVVALAIVVIWWFWPANKELTKSETAQPAAQPGLLAAGNQIRSGDEDRADATPTARPQESPPPDSARDSDREASSGDVSDREQVTAIEMGVAPPRGTATQPPPPSVKVTESDRVGEGAGQENLTAAARRAFARAQEGLDLLTRNRPIEGRRLLTAALDSGELSPKNAQTVRDSLTELSQRLVFSPEVVEGDPFVLAYRIESGDALSRLPRKLGVHTDWRFIQRINRIRLPERIRVNQSIKLITGPFHAVIHKRDYRMDLYLGEGVDRVYVCSFPVGLGEYNSTPEGRFRVRDGSRLMNPEWVNPRTGQRFRAGDPDNPIGEYWIGLKGSEERLQDVFGYGIHGTIEPESIGRESSMGCVRMLPDDVAIVWEVLLDPVSTVEIRP